MTQLSASRPESVSTGMEDHGELPAVLDLAGARQEAPARATAGDWEALFDALPDEVAVIDCDHRFVRVNRRMAARFHLDVEAVVGRHCYELVHGTSAPPAFCPHTRALEDLKGHAARIYEPTLCGFFDVIAVPLLDRARGMTGCVHVLREIVGERAARMPEEPAAG